VARRLGQVTLANSMREALMYSMSGFVGSSPVAVRIYGQIKKAWGFVKDIA